MSSEPTLDELKEKLTEEEALYGELLEQLDALAGFQAPFDRDDALVPMLEALNDADALRETPKQSPTGIAELVRRLIRRFIEPEIADLRLAYDRQRAFNSQLVQFINRFAEASNHAAASEAEFASTLIRYAQRIDRLADAKDRLYASLGNTRSDLLLEAMDKRLETVRLGLRRLNERVEGANTSLALTRAELTGLTRAAERRPSTAPVPTSREDEHYVAFEERFRGSSDALAERLQDYVPFFENKAPVVDLGCGRGEFLELLSSADIEARGIDGNAEMVEACRGKGLAAEVGDVLRFVSDAKAESIGGVFAAQLIEHLRPDRIRSFLDDCHRIVRPGGCVILETVNPASVAGFVGFYRDLTHQKPLHPETLDFLLRGAGFRDVTTRYTSPVGERSRLLSVESGAPSHETLNHNFDRLNAFLFAELDYAAIATK